MGPSGSGKTTLPNVLAGQLAASPQLHLSGHLNVNGRPSYSRRFKIEYVRQEDLFFSQLTVREPLSLAAELQVTDVTSVGERDDYVKKLLFKFVLVNCADSIVGDAKVRGINGGEKKSLSLACELIASPSVIFADETTTGLDAFQTEWVIMETLRQLAQDGRQQSKSKPPPKPPPHQIHRRHQGEHVIHTYGIHYNGCAQLLLQAQNSQITEEVEPTWSCLPCLEAHLLINRPPRKPPPEFPPRMNESSNSLLKTTVLMRCPLGIFSTLRARSFSRRGGMIHA